ncbi:MAG TPA: pilus assembly protein PilM [Candidatus Limnocylindrales bacterium]|nr:pilus assembly protein PilM [Candidatus Limnocylindrales bacterium]
MSEPRKKPSWGALKAFVPGSAASGDSMLPVRVRSLLSSPWPDLVGVDLSDRAVRVVHVVRRGSRVTRIESGERLLPNAEMKPADRRTALNAALRDLVFELGLRGKNAAAAVSGNEVVIRRMALPEMSRSDLLAALALECRKHVNFPIEESEIRYEIVGRSDRAGSPELLLSVCVAHRRRIMEVREALEESGLRVSLLTTRPVALRALLRATGMMPSEEVVAYLDIGGANTHITVLKGNDVRFSREFGVGGATLTEALRAIVVPGQGTIELSYEEAEALKRAHGIPLGKEEAGHAGRIPLSAVSVMLRPILERLARELWNSFDYCNEQFQGETVSRLVLLGAGARVRNLADYLTGVLKIPVVRADLAESMGEVARQARRKAPAGAQPPSELGLGLALTERGAPNFATPASAGIPYRLAEVIPPRIAAAAAVVLLFSVALPSHINVVNERSRLEGLKGDLAGLSSKTESVRRFRAAREEETRLHDLLAHLTGGQVLWSYALRDLSHRIGSDVRLTLLEVLEPQAATGDAAAGAERPARQIRLTGLLRTQNRRPEDVVGELMQSLERSPVFGQVRLEGCQAVSSSVSSFVMTAAIAE